MEPAPCIPPRVTYLFFRYLKRSTATAKKVPPKRPVMTIAATRGNHIHRMKGPNAAHIRESDPAGHKKRVYVFVSAYDGKHESSPPERVTAGAPEHFVAPSQMAVVLIPSRQEVLKKYCPV